MSTQDDLSFLGEGSYSDAVKQLEGLLVQDRRAFLLGAGCSRCAGLPLISELMEIVANNDELGETSKEILEGIEYQFKGTEDSHIEDYLSELVDLIAITDRRVLRGASEKQILICNKKYSQEQLRKAITEIKEVIVGAISQPPEIKTHQQFVQAVHKPVRVGRTDSNLAVSYLVLNYDTVLESALAMEQISFSDGMDGGATGWWNPETLEHKAAEACVLKLHGSIDWCELPDDPLPRRIPNNLKVEGMDDKRALIWPASTKYRETQLDPFAQLSNKARCIMRPKFDSQLVLIVCGYSFGDTHINSEIKEALDQSSGNLTVIVFSSEDKPSGCLQEWTSEPTIKDQVLIFAKGGFFHGDKEIRSESDLPWWKFENVVRILRGEHGS